MKKIISACAVIAAVIGRGVPALAASSEQGRWDTSPANCRESITDSYNEIDAKNVTGSESGCQIAKRSVSGEVVTLRLIKCSDEGGSKPHAETWTLRPGDTTMAVRIDQSGEKPRSFTLYRCK